LFISSRSKSGRRTNSATVSARPLHVSPPKGVGSTSSSSSSAKWKGGTYFRYMTDGAFRRAK
jgi:hypothetical protein